MEIARTHDTLRVRDSDLNRSAFDDVNLQGASFTNVNLANAAFVDINLSNAFIKDANLTGMTIDGVLVSELIRVYHSRATR
jgi:uncharacterized protein YjbI with pentapeptide repeats